MELHHILREARAFLVRNGISAGEVLAVDVGPELEVPPADAERLPFQESYRSYFVGFCRLPIDDPFHPTLVVCEARRDLTVEGTDENPIPIWVGWHDGQLPVPRGQYSLLEVIGRCRAVAESRNVAMEELLRCTLADGVWRLYFRRGNLSRFINGDLTVLGCFFVVDDLTGEVASSIGLADSIGNPVHVLFLRDRLYAWAVEAIRNESCERFDDLHVVDLVPGFDGRNFTQTDLQQYIPVLHDVSARLPWNFSIALAISLTGGATAQGLRFYEGEWTKELSDTPPSFYVFRRGTEPWKVDAHSAVAYRAADLWPASKEVQCYFIEYKEAGEMEYRRSLWIACS